MLKLPSGFGYQPSNEGVTLWPRACGRGASRRVSCAGAGGAPRTIATAASPTTAGASSLRISRSPIARSRRLRGTPRLYTPAHRVGAGR